jgi:thiamine biosynthesis lipoprotein
MGTFLNVCITGTESASLAAIFLDEVQRLEGLLSKYQPESDVSRINRAAGDHAVSVSRDTFQVIETALHFAAQSEGAFDPTLEPFGYRFVRMDLLQRSIFLERAGMALDLGGIGKGFALDKALAKVKGMGTLESLSADFGGQLLFWHKNGSFAPETILIENTLTGAAADAFEVSSNCSISTSSNAERPGHLRHPLTGKSVQNNESVTVIASTGMEAEALSTTYFIAERFGVHDHLRLPSHSV